MYKTLKHSGSTQSSHWQSIIDHYRYLQSAHSSDIEADVEGGDEEELLSEPDDGLLGDELLEPAVEAVLEEVQTAAVIEDDLLLVPADILADLPPATDILADLPRAADILAELPDYPDSEEEEQKVRHIMKVCHDMGNLNFYFSAIVFPDKHMTLWFFENNMSPRS